MFSCLCYPNLSSTAQHKLSPHSFTCVYLGPSSEHHGHFCIDLITQRFITSRQVIFDEEHFPFTKFNSPLTVFNNDMFLLDDTPTLYFIPQPDPPLVTNSTHASPRITSLVPPHISSFLGLLSMLRLLLLLFLLLQRIPWSLVLVYGHSNQDIFLISPLQPKYLQFLVLLLRLSVTQTGKLPWILKWLLLILIILGILLLRLLLLTLSDVDGCTVTNLTAMEILIVTKVPFLLKDSLNFLVMTLMTLLVM